MNVGLDCQGVSLQGEQQGIVFYLALAAVTAVTAACSRDGQIILRHTWRWGALAVLACAHRFLAANAAVHWLRDRERYFGADAPVLVEHFVTDILWAWAASIMVRALPGMARDLRRQYQDRRLSWLYVGISAGTPIVAAAMCYFRLGASPVWIIPLLLAFAILLT